MNTSEYIIKKLEELGITKIFGVPGDYNFNLIYAIENNPSTDWIGCSNELNSGYAADGYARQNGYGTVLTTYGVGELSVINAISGALAENVPVISIVGTPAADKIGKEKLFHHCIENAPINIFEGAFKSLGIETAFLDRANAKLETDRIFKTFVKNKKPVYIAIPEDVAQMEISEKDVDYGWESNYETLRTVGEKIIEKIRNSKKPIIIGDILVERFESVPDFREFVEKTNIPATNFLTGKALLNENFKNYLGDYLGKNNTPIIDKYLRETDCLIAIGTIYSDLNSFNMDLPYKIKSGILIQGTCTYVDGIKYEDVKMNDVLSYISEKAENRKYETEKEFVYYPPPNTENNTLCSEYLYSRIQEFMKENDILVAETGTIPHGVCRMKFPENIKFYTQSLWLSIGWATPAAFGISMASPDKRVILLTGDGAHQMSALEIGNMIRHGLQPVIIVINNNGYTTERLLSKDFDGQFNNIPPANYSKIPKIFGENVWTVRVDNADDFDKALRVTQIVNKLCYIEVCMPKDDIPEFAKNIAKTDKNEPIPNNNIYKSSDYKKIVLENKDTNYTTISHESLKDENQWEN